jgi:hypothetical protein
MHKSIGLFAIVNTDNEKYFEEWLIDPFEYGEQPCWVDNRLKAWNTISLENALAHKRQLLNLGYEVDVLAYDGVKVG